MNDRLHCNVHVDHNLKRYRVTFSRSGHVLLVAVKLGRLGERAMEINGVRGKRIVALARKQIWDMLHA